MKQAKLWATQGSKLAKMIVKRQQKSSSSITELYSHTQPSTCSPELHQGPRSLIWIASGLGEKQLAEPDHSMLPHFGGET